MPLRLFPVSSPTLLRISGRTFNRIEDLRHHTLLHLSDTQNAWPWLQWSEWLKEAGAPGPLADIGLRFSHFDQMIHAATMGHGIALGSSPLVDYLLKEGALVAPLVKRLVSPRSFYICRGPRSDDAVSSLVDWLMTAVETPDAETGPLETLAGAAIDLRPWLV
ncbi:LysR substrate-binding domain-containing protein [Pseudomonas sp. CCI3.2]|uniref:LysR substrate-binding domain-containing protein n=1 Tax=unclassified Pseudomonas TaxID=196821 RepID=UPI002AC8CBF6|nr:MULTISPECIES: LysR substrate-binding domain-containing protein [unclassified Pseudomonas]MEB0078082.1 LysR substrate-binding domain-containing protein [Pseudomonas sp. MH10out]MEB0089965.1 LysR substrate-binding domain-containing protein [Pseudomonas sp. CCI4.2]MEB0103198.1 LysR substrate-binding domain-containing protein [Pseudomonas sp. CCI3.2]MEB0132887.1 LysR substrate-binding domain-containing protein [Pseudomonas sp. CCI2.4]MEB0158894.1 LysR substrate-binding domain-containing protein